MTIGVQLFSVAAAVAALVLVFLMLRRKSFRERHAIWYLVAAVGAVVVSIFPGITQWAAKLIGVAEPLNLAFFVAVIILFLIAVQFASELTSAEARIRRLAEETALRDARLDALEREIAELKRGHGLR